MVPKISLSERRAQGEGCPSGQGSVTLSPDQKALSVLFGNYSVEVGGDKDARRAEKNCRVSIPLRIPPGLQLEVVRSDYRGFNSLPKGTAAMLSVSQLIIGRDGKWALGRTGRTIQKAFSGPLDDEFTFSDTLDGTFLSPCGGSARLLVGMNLIVRTRTGRVNGRCP